MIHLAKVEVRGKAEAGDFSGTLTFAPGLQVISAHNAYGKSLAVRAITWCLGLEPIFGNLDNDPVRLPEAVRGFIDLDGHANSRVISAEASITIRDDAERELVITRDIKGGDLNSVKVCEKSADGKERESRLIARRRTMQDEHGGFQRFFFEWMKWPRLKVSTYRPGGSEIYLENLAPLFYIDQDEGWSNIQALQIARYGQQEISEIAVEYLLGALDAVRARVIRLESEQRARDLKESARLVAEQAMDTMIRRGWRVDWSGYGSLKEIISRWTVHKFREALQEAAHVDIAARIQVVRNKEREAPERTYVTASELSATERELERLTDASKEIDEIQASIDCWVADARAFESGTIPPPDIAERKAAFTNELRHYLIALGHSALQPHNAHSLSLDDEYVPFMEGRRLRSLGSASDQSRLIAAYSLALAATSRQMQGKHPGFVILDEPLQQNPDDKHKKLFFTFLEKQLAQQSKFQTLIFTWLSDSQIGYLRKQNTAVITPPGQHFLQLTPKMSEPTARPSQTAPPAPDRSR